MQNIKDKILRFNELSTEEQRAVEAYVDAHPEWQPFLDEVKALEALRNEVRMLRDADDEVLAYYVVAQHLGVGVSAPLQRVFDRVEERLAHDDELREQYERLVRRLERIVAALDPVAQFEELSGFRVPAADDAETRSERTDREPVEGARSSVHRMAYMFSRSRTAHWAVAAVLFMAVLYGGLFAVSHVTQSEVDRLALVDVSEIEAYEPATRGTQQAPSDSLSADALYLRALQTLRDARVTTLGLFPRYDQEKLKRAEALLQRIIEREEDHSFLRLEAHFFLGKVHLAQGDVEAARSNFQTVATCEGRRTTEAMQILTELEEQCLAEGQSYVSDRQWLR